MSSEHMRNTTKRFKDQPIARKALVLGLIPTLCAVTLAVVLSFLATYLQARNTQAQDLQTEATIVASNVAAALAFNDVQAAADTVQAFRAKNNIDSVCVFNEDGFLFASFVQGPGTCPARHDAAVDERANAPVYERAVLVGTRHVGVVRLTGNLSRLYLWMRNQLFVAFGTLMAGLLVALLLTRQLGRAITAPVLSLVTAADDVSTTGTYTTRVPKTTDDELGRLAQSFNDMLDRIQRQQEATVTLLEREQEANRLKDQFLATVSHELRTPLNAILGWLQIIRTTNPTPETIERAFESLQRNAHAQARVIDDLLEISRVVTGKLHLKTEVVDLNAAVKAAVEAVNPAMSAKGVRLSLLLPDVPALVSGDADRLQQVVWNLLSNAVKFTPSGGSMTVGLTPAGTDFVLTVEDTGIGISQEFLPFIFDRFRQADGTFTREHGGLGLGLAIVKDLTERHGGTVSVVSAGKGKGTTVTVRFPRLIGEETGKTKPFRPAADAPLMRGALSGIRVLAVDDDRDALDVVGEGLRAAGADVHLASSGAEAIAAEGRERFDVIVCDLAMPQIDGMEALKAMRERHNGSGNDQFAIALTAHASQDDHRRSLAAGFHHHFSKPYDLNELIEAIRSGVRERHD